MAGKADLKMKYFEEKYETLTTLGEQADSNICLVRNVTDGKIYVRKQIGPEAVPVYDKLKMLVHKNIARVYETAWNEEGGVVIEEFINGITLDKYLETEGVLKESEVRDIVIALCNALFKIHNSGMIHRDIKPENIMISNDGVVKLIDFGIARVIKDQQSRDTTILGTVGYAAPEQFGYTQTDARSDIYAVGVLMNKLLTGKLPTQGIYSVPPMSDIIRRCIEIDARNRFQTIQELMRTMETAGLTQGSVAVELNNSTKEQGLTIKGVPGFRTGVIWKNVVATVGYIFLIFATYCCMIGFTSSVEVFLLEAAAVFLYIWAATLIAFNAADWDRKIYPFCIFPKPVMTVIRIVLWIVIFYWGILIENHVKYDLLGMIPPS